MASHEIRVPNVRDFADVPTLPHPVGTLALSGEAFEGAITNLYLPKKKKKK